MRLGIPFGALAFVAALASGACQDEQNVGTGGGGGSGGSGGSGASTTTTTTSSTTSTSQGGGGSGSGECSVAQDCPGNDTECSTRTCVANVCGFDLAPAGTVLAQQVAGDCTELVCDGAGDVTGNADATDLPDDANDCTIDGCNGTQPQFTPASAGEPCAGPGNEVVCNDAGTCVECIDAIDCASGVCTPQFTCASASCADLVQNGAETDVDCGGPDCQTCAVGEGCAVSADCTSGDCQGGTCQPTCTDGLLDQDESDVDCGGATCAPCPVGGSCGVDGDCMSGLCSGSCDEYQLLVSELRSRGPGGGSDDFVELYNPLDVDVTLGADIEIAARSDGAAAYSPRWTAAGQIVPAHGHVLVAGPAYSAATIPDDALSSGIADKVSVVVRRAGTVLDAVCLYCGATDPFDATYDCEGAAFVLVGCTSNNSDRSLERKPGGALGSGTDTGDSATDFQITTPADPQNLSSPPAP